MKLSPLLKLLLPVPVVLGLLYAVSFLPPHYSESETVKDYETIFNGYVSYSNYATSIEGLVQESYNLEGELIAESLYSASLPESQNAAMIVYPNETGTPLSFNKMDVVLNGLYSLYSLSLVSQNEGNQYFATPNNGYMLISDDGTVAKITINEDEEIGHISISNNGRLISDSKLTYKLSTKSIATIQKAHNPNFAEETTSGIYVVQPLAH